MIDPVTALAAISSAVQLVKKVSKTVDDVASLGPVLGKYFDAKEQAIEVVKQAKAGGFKGSSLGKALELEMALEQAREFEESVKMLFFQSNKMDVWQRITGYVAFAFIFMHVSSLRWGWTYGGAFPSFDAHHAALAQGLPPGARLDGEACGGGGAS